jgi:hypothetical protein
LSAPEAFDAPSSAGRAAADSPDRWSIARGKTEPRPRSTTERLRPGQLDPLVLDYLEAHGDAGPLGTTAVATGLGRSAGAVGNCLARLPAVGRMRQVGDHPRRYQIP